MASNTFDINLVVFRNYLPNYGFVRISSIPKVIAFMSRCCTRNPIGRKNVCIVGTGEASISATTATNMTVLAGTSIKLACETETGSSIRWHFNSPQLPFPFVLYTGSDNSDVESSVAWRISVNKTDNWNEITVRNVGTDDSGQYSCHEVPKLKSNVNFYVTVQGTLRTEITFH